MGYFKDLYVKPFVKTNKEWKTLLISVGIDIVLILIVLSLVLIAATKMTDSSRPLNDNVLTEVSLINNAQLYASELESFIQSFYFIIISLGIVLFLLYSFSRTFIWNKIIKKKTKYFRNLIIDFVMIFLLIGGFVAILTFVKESTHAIIIPLYLVLIIYYSLFVHINLGNKLKKVFCINFKKSILLLPHSLIFGLIITIFLNSEIGLFIAVILFNYYRIFSSMI